MYPGNGESSLTDLGLFHKCRAVIDLIYNPPVTGLMRKAQKQGINNINGLLMLVAQAKKSAELFLNTSIPDTVIEKVASKIARSTRNIVLIGMPGCGKSSIGAALAKKMSREFADTDDLVTETAGKPIPEIFAQDGEETFRKLENEILEDLCKRSGLVIATGGGIVKRQENRDIIRQNGFIVFLDRDINHLPVSGRPLSGKEGVTKLAAERIPLYSQWCDFSAEVNGIDSAAASIYKKYQGVKLL